MKEEGLHWRISRAAAPGRSIGFPVLVDDKDFSVCFPILVDNKDLGHPLLLVKSHPCG